MSNITVGDVTEFMKQMDKDLAETIPQEWTSDKVIMMGVDDADVAYKIANAHNAALAAERERNKTLMEALEGLPKAAYLWIIEDKLNPADLPNELQCMADAALAKVKEGE
jgi:hypothetical protein